MSKLFQYTGCGLDYVYLLNGYEEVAEDGETFVAISSADELHDAIAHVIVTSPRRLRGQEVRFLRGRLGLSQEALGEAIGDCSRSTVARWEAERNAPIDGSYDKELRLLYILHRTENAEMQSILRELRAKDEHKYGQGFSDLAQRVFASTEHGWEMQEAA